MSKRMWTAGAALALVAVLAAPGAAQVDPGLESYKPVGGVSGKIASIGSDTLHNLMTLWTEEFKKAYPNVSTEVESKGSSAQLGPMSRAM